MSRFSRTTCYGKTLESQGFEDKTRAGFWDSPKNLFQKSTLVHQSFDPVILRQDLHLADSDGIELCQPLGLMPKCIEFDTVKRRVV